MRNVLQLNNGNGTFSDIAQVGGIHYTDWSWTILFIDIENDGDRDLFITNGSFRDVNNKDYLRIKLKGHKENPDGYGARSKVAANGVQQYQEMYVTRGYLSSMEPIVHFGLGDASEADVRDLGLLRLANGKTMVLVGNNGDKLQSFIIQQNNL